RQPGGGLRRKEPPAPGWALAAGGCPDTGPERPQGRVRRFPLGRAVPTLSLTRAEGNEREEIGEGGGGPRCGGPRVGPVRVAMGRAERPPSAGGGPSTRARRAHDRAP